MKKKDLLDLKAKSEAELEKFVQDNAKELSKIKTEFTFGRVKNVRSMKLLKTNIARAKTLLSQMKLSKEVK